MPSAFKMSYTLLFVFTGKIGATAVNGIAK